MTMPQFDVQAVSGGFTDPVFEAQAAFRALMDASARPGTIHDLPAGLAPPAPLGAGPAAVMLALCDPDTPVWLAEALCGEATSAWIAFQCGAPFVGDSARAAFAFAGADDMPALSALNAGTQEYPDRATTLVVEVEALEGGEEIILEGPGILGRWHIAPKGLPQSFVSEREDNRALFPRGVDVVLVAGSRVMALPRTTVLSRKSEMEAN
ncbi:phosphonate C-P lyase system protein PhnH [Stappia sp.]